MTSFWRHKHLHTRLNERYDSKEKSERRTSCKTLSQHQLELKAVVRSQAKRCQESLAYLLSRTHHCHNTDVPNLCLTCIHVTFFPVHSTHHTFASSFRRAVSCGAFLSAKALHQTQRNAIELFCNVLDGHGYHGYDCL